MPSSIFFEKICMKKITYLIYETYFLKALIQKHFSHHLEVTRFVDEILYSKKRPGAILVKKRTINCLFSSWCGGPTKLYACGSLCTISSCFYSFICILYIHVVVVSQGLWLLQTLNEVLISLDQLYFVYNNCKFIMITSTTYALCSAVLGH